MKYNIMDSESTIDFMTYYNNSVEYVHTYFYLKRNGELFNLAPYSNKFISSEENIQKVLFLFLMLKEL